MHSLRKTIATSTIAAGLMLSGATGAQALTKTSHFTSTIPRFQQTHYWEYQNKTTKKPSQVHFSSIGSKYLMNVKAQNGSSKKQYKEKKGIGKGTSVSISNSTPKGTATRLLVTNHTWGPVTVSVTGWYKTN